MNLPFFYEPVIAQPHFTLSEETSKHCIQVLRMKANDKLHLTDGKGNLFTAAIINADKKHCIVNIEKDLTINHQQIGNNVSVAISLLKNPSRLEWFMEKATEIGVHEIHPLICEHTEKENFRFERMNGILISAMLQSQQTWLPLLHQPKKFNLFMNEDFDGAKLIAYCNDENRKSINNYKQKNVIILIGPEGDFSETEIQSALQKNFIPITLGNTRLRSETAGMVAAALLCN